MTGVIILYTYNSYNVILLIMHMETLIKQVDELPSKNQALCILCNLYCFGVFCFTLLYSLCYYKKLNHC